MVDDFFLGFAGHAHTRNDVVPDPNLDLHLRKENGAEEALKLTEAVLSIRSRVIFLARDITSGM